MKRLLLLGLCLCLTGCSHTYLERQIYPICLSLDMLDDGRYQVGLQAPQSANGGSTGYDVLSAAGETPMDALRVLAASIPYPLNFSQIRLCLISYELASQQPLLPLLRGLFQLPTMRPNAYVMTAMGSALEVMTAQKPDLGMRLSTHLNLLFERLRREQTLPDSTLSTCVRELGDGRSDFLLCLCAVNTRLQSDKPDQQPVQPGGDAGGASAAFAAGEPWSNALLPDDILAGMMPRTSLNPVEYVGSAAVSEGRVCGVLTARETQLAVRVLHSAKLRTAVKGGLQLQVILPRSGELDGCEGEITALIRRLQAMGSDALTFGRIASMAFATDAAWQAYDFRALYPQAETAVR